MLSLPETSYTMQLNWIAIFGAALVPLMLGFVWYNNKVFGKAWMTAAGLTEEQLRGANMARIFIATFILSLLLALELNVVVTHQWHLYSIMANDPNMLDPHSETGQFLNDFMGKYGDNFRTFKHGAFHGVVAGLFLVLPVVGINALFERKGFRYIALHTGYWVVCLAIMGGIICAAK